MPLDSPCDSCFVRRVKCDRQHPCETCLVRSQNCTYFRVRKRPGPKGPRSITHRKIQEIQQGHPETSVMEPTDTTPESPPQALYAPGSRIAVTAYYTVLGLFRCRLYDIWPIVSIEDLRYQVRDTNADPVYHALAAALCAATLAQMRLWHTPDLTPEGPSSVTAEDFAKECLRIRRYTYHQDASLSALVTSIFLHMYYANSDQITPATLSLREAITYADLMHLGTTPPSDPDQSKQWQLELRSYWILFVTERTFCIQHDLPINLQRTHYLPEIEKDASQGDLYAGFCYLVQLFLHVQRPLLPPVNKTTEAAPAIYSKDHILDIQQRIKSRLPGLELTSEIQSVDILATSAWVRSLLWQYSASRFMLSSATSIQPLSLDYPISIARDLLESLSSVSIEAIRSHGYGMEIKLLQVANSVIDIVLCIPDLLSSQACRFGPLDAILAIEQLLLTVGGTKSERLCLLHERLAQIPSAMALPRMLEIPDQEDDSPQSYTDNTQEGESRFRRLVS